MTSGNQPSMETQTASTGVLLRGLLISYLLTAISLGLAGYLWGKDGFDLLVVGMGWPHVIFGLVFNLGKLSEGDRNYRAALAGLLLLTLAIGFVNSLRPLTTIIYLYFTFHAFRDEIFIYRQRKTGYRFSGRVFDRSGLALLFGAAVIALIGQLPLHSPEGKMRLYLAVCGLAGVLSIRARQLGLRYAFLALFLFAGAASVVKMLRVQGLNGPHFFAFLVVFHYFSWYVYSLERVRAQESAPQAQRPASRRAGLLQSLRRLPGFLQAVAVMNIVFMGGAYAYYVLHLVPIMGIVFDFKRFVYLLVFHVTTSFVPKISRSATRVWQSMPGTIAPGAGT